MQAFVIKLEEEEFKNIQGARKQFVTVSKTGLAIHNTVTALKAVTALGLQTSTGWPWSLVR